MKIIKKTANRIIILMLILVFCFAFQAINAFAFDFGSGLYWNVENGVLVIGGEGSMQSEVPWVDYKDSITGVTIKEDVTDISSEAFSNCPNLKNVQIGSNVKVIGSGAFKNCPELEKYIFLNKCHKYPKEPSMAAPV